VVVPEVARSHLNATSTSPVVQFAGADRLGLDVPVVTEVSPAAFGQAIAT
jgi:hypothetical protein